MTLPAAELSPLAGRYFSSELNATYDLSTANGSLVLRRSRTVDTLRALDARTFRGGGVTLHFAPAPHTGPDFTVENGRARGIEFARVKSGE